MYLLEIKVDVGSLEFYPQCLHCQQTKLKNSHSMAWLFYIMLHLCMYMFVATCSALFLHIVT